MLFGCYTPTMRWPTDSSRTSLAVVVVLGLLLAVLATLQYRWIAQLSEAERARLQEDLDEAADGFCEDFDTEIAVVLAAFDITMPEDDDELAGLLNDRLAAWRSVAMWPGMVRELFVVRTQEAGESRSCASTTGGSTWPDANGRASCCRSGAGSGTRRPVCPSSTESFRV